MEQLWEGTKPLQKLVHIDLSDSQYLNKTPDLTKATNLQRLNLQRCVSLVEVDPSISALKKLVYLNLQGCKELKILPSFTDMNFLEVLNLSGCSNLGKYRPVFLEGMKELKILCLGETAITELPSSINNLSRLQILRLGGCRELRNLPSIHLKSLQDLDLSGCSNLETFPEISKDMKELKELSLDETAITELPSSINHLRGLQTLSLSNQGLATKGFTSSSLVITSSTEKGQMLLQNVIDAEEIEQVDEEGYKSSNTDKIDVRRLKSDQFR
ncbi:hypothetical protein M0R45_034804 [Rubus argutus]|uniref:Disease resistance R13L4/SHOC-2-like LRR domain-containing protein n=1 Tax=Rubus argutus TaxID=59490 RepID=A0AAW1VSX7_RUBAR